MNKGMYIMSSSDNLTQGKSFRFLGDWDQHRRYLNDDYVQDFVTYEGKLWGCLEGNVGSSPSCHPSKWSIAVNGVKGRPGKEILSMYEKESHFDAYFNYSTIVVVYNDGTNESFTITSRLAKGDPGETPVIGVTTIEGQSYWTVNNNIIKDEKGNPVPCNKPGIQGPPGANGKDGINGKDGKDGLPGRDGLDGKNGVDGKDGKDGAPGKNGLDGANGKTYIPSITEDGVLSFTISDTPTASPILSDLDEYFVSHKELQTILDSFNLHWNIIN